MASQKSSQFSFQPRTYQNASDSSLPNYNSLLIDNSQQVIVEQYEEPCYTSYPIYETGYQIQVSTSPYTIYANTAIIDRERRHVLFRNKRRRMILSVIITMGLIFSMTLFLRWIFYTQITDNWLSLFIFSLLFIFK